MKNSGIPLSAFPAHVQAQIRRSMLLDGDAHVLVTGGDPATAKVVPAPDGPSIRQRQGPQLNKTEAAFSAHIRALFPSSLIFDQAVTLVLANGLRYTPDVFFPGTGVRPAFYEVKGFMRDDAAAKLKMAAEVHRWADFFLVSRKGRASPWRIQIVLPLTGR